MRNKPNEFELACFGQFVGKRIICFAFTDVGEFLLPTFTFDDGTFAQVWCDPEGNGPGHIGLYDLGNGNEIVP